MAEPQTTLSVSEILSGYRDLGSSWRPKDAIYLSCDPAFNRYTRLWVKGPTLDATNGALEALRLLGCSAFDDGKIYRLLKRQFLPQTGTFATDGTPVSGGIYGLHNALGILKSLHGLPPKKALGLRLYEEALRRIGRPEPRRDIERFRLFLRKCVASGRSRGGLVDHPSMDPYIPTVTTLHTTTSTLWNLWENDCKDLLDEILPLSAIEQFIRKCLREKTIEGQEIAAFAINPQVGELCTNTTFFALETLWHLAGEKLAEREDLLNEKQRERILRFLTHVAWVEGSGGFRSTIGEIPSLNATFFALRALRRLSLPAFTEFVGTHLEAILGFVESCSDDGGHAFTNRHDRYLPTPLATRYALQIRELLHKKGFEVPPPAQAPGDDRSIHFLQSEMRIEKTGAYQGYPPSRIRGAEQFDAQDLYFWDPVAAEKRAAQTKQLFALLADGLQKAWALDRGITNPDEPEEVRFRDGSVLHRRKPLSRAPAPQPRYRVRKTSDGGVAIEASSRPLRPASSPKS
jgi:hypothetical protein